MSESGIIIELIGGPRDGIIGRLKKPAEAVLRLKSEINPQYFCVYEFDDDPKNVELPFKFKFKRYEKGDDT